MKNGHALHIYFGNGKGKTTAAMGLAMRASGQGMRVLIAQMLKNNDSGELSSLALLPGTTVVYGLPVQKLTYQMNDDEIAAEMRRQAKNFSNVQVAVKREKPDLIVLDEALVAESLGFLPLNPLLEQVEEWLTTAEVVLTGRNPNPALLEMADYATEMVKHKHPFDSGVCARRGVEF